MRVLGFDPGLRITGYAIVDAENPFQPALVEAGCIRVPTQPDLAERIAYLHKHAAELVEEFQPDAVAVEELFSHYERPKTAILMGHARGVLLLAAGAKKIPVSGYAPTKVKRSLTGSGSADKEQMTRAIQQTFHLPAPPKPADVSDALAIALCHAQHAFARQAG